MLLVGILAAGSVTTVALLSVIGLGFLIYGVSALRTGSFVGERVG